MAAGIIGYSPLKGGAGQGGFRQPRPCREVETLSGGAPHRKAHVYGVVDDASWTGLGGCAFRMSATLLDEGVSTILPCKEG